MRLLRLLRHHKRVPGSSAATWKRVAKRRKRSAQNDDVDDDDDDEDTTFEAPKFDLDSTFKPEAAERKSEQEKVDATFCTDFLQASTAAKSCVDTLKGLEE